MPDMELYGLKPWYYQLSQVSPFGFVQCWAAETPARDAGGEFANRMAVLPSGQNPEHRGSQAAGGDIFA